MGDGRSSLYNLVVMDEPRVSIILTTYNRSDMLSAALKSVDRQLFSAWELIVCDDGSTDDTPQLIQHFQEEIPLQYLRLPHSGHPEKSRNAGMAKAQGQYIAFLDDDDFWLPIYLALMVGRLDQQPEVGLVYCDLRFRYPDGHLSQPRLTQQEKKGHRLRNQLASGLALYPSILVFRRRLLADIGMIDENPDTHGDLAFLLRMAWATEAGCVSEPLVFIRRSPAGLSTRRNRQHFRNAITALTTFMSQNNLDLGHRLRFHRTLARHHTHLALIFQAEGHWEKARQYLIRSIRLNPLQRQAWIALARSGRK